jgi:hypothetical protein
MRFESRRESKTKNKTKKGKIVFCKLKKYISLVIFLLFSFFYISKMISKA